MKKSLFVFVMMAAGVSGAAHAACTGTTNAAAGPTIGTAAAPELTANTCVCNGLAERNQINGGSGAAVDVAAAQFIKNGFVIQCSANSMVSMSDISPTRFAVGGASRRGSQAHIGSSNGGAVSVGPTACTGGTANARECVVADVTAAVGDATTQANAN